MRLVMLALIAGLGAIQTASAAERLRIATEGGYPPWNSITPAGTLEGFEIDLARDLCQRLQTECEIIAQNWDGLIPGLLAGKYDAIMAAMSITEKRRAVMAFSRPYAAEPATFATLMNNPLLALGTGINVDLAEMSPEERQALDTLKVALTGKTVGVQMSTSHQVFVETMLPETAVRLYRTMEEATADLRAERLDALLAARSTLLRHDGLSLFGPMLSRGLFGAGVGVGLRQGDADLLDRFDRAIKEAVQSGATARISERWFGVDISVKEPGRRSD